jgi:glycosyltransferase involved in cell wall biosynthesis
MFGWEFPPYISGGLGTACYGITRGLTHKGVEVLFVIPRAREGDLKSHVRLVSASRVQVPREIHSTTEFFRRMKLRTINSLLRPYLTATEYTRILQEVRESSRTLLPKTSAASILEMTGDYGPNLFAEIARYSEVAEVLARTERFDIIHAHDWMTILAGIRAKHASGKPLVLHVHALEFDRSGENVNQQVYALEKLGLENADHIIAVSYYTRQILIDRYGVAPDRISVVHNAVSRRNVTHAYHVERTHREKVVLFLGRVTFQKGPDYFVEAAAKVLQKVPDVTFVMAGSGDMLPRMIERVGQLRIGHHFHFTGFLRGPEVERMYALTDLYVMPSVSEPFGISPLEAMIYDIPVIVSKHAGVAEVMTHALKVDFWDIQDMANKIIAVLKYPALSREMCRNCRHELRNIRWDVAGEKIAAVYRQLCQ